VCVCVCVCVSLSLSLSLSSKVSEQCDDRVYEVQSKGYEVKSDFSHALK
jgi:hypothetical protein